MAESDEPTLWQPVSNENQYNDYPLAFVNVDQDTEEVTFNIDGDEVEPEDREGPMVQGTYKGLQDISAEDNPQPSMKHLVESEKDERTYAFNNVTALGSSLEEVETGEVVGIDFEGYVEPEDGLPWQNFQVYRPAK